MDCRCESHRGMAYAMSNRTENSVSIFARDLYGALHFMEEQVTAGIGTNQAIVDPLGSQGSLVLSKCGRFLFAVNAGNHTVSSFRLRCGCRTPVGVVDSGGIRPVSIAQYGDILYVLNAGDGSAPANLSGFTVCLNGTLAPIPGSTVYLSTANPQPACAVFSPDGRYLVVSEKGTNLLLTFSVRPGGLLTDRVITASNGSVPFGMVFTESGVLLVAEAGPNALSSYEIARDHTLRVISGSVPNNQGATCWVAVTPNGRHAYTSNAATGTISLYRVCENGELTLVESVPTTPRLNGAPIDSAIDACGKYLYVLNGSQGSISVFRIGCEGHPALIQIYENTALPEIGAQGIAVS